MVAVLVLIAMVRLDLMNFPLERDEGEYAYAGQLMLQGIPPYELAYNMKFPGTYAAYALIMALFGETPGGIHAGVMCVTTLTALMLFWLGKRILNPSAGMVAATCYAVLATNSNMFGLAGHATHFAAVFATAGLCLLWRARDNSSWLAAGTAGVMFGTAVLMKQHAVMIGLWAMLAWTAWYFRKTEISPVRRLSAVAALGAGMILPFGLCCLILWHAGVLGRFWFWTIDYARAYVSVIPLSMAGRALWWTLSTITAEDYLLWAFVAAGIILIWFEPRLRPARHWIFGFATAGALTTAPGLYFRTHYFLLALPAAALLAACAVDALVRLWNQHVRNPRLQNWPVPALYVLMLALTLVQNRELWSNLARAQGKSALAAHIFCGTEPFPEAEEVSRVLRASSNPDARIAVIGSEPEIYFLSRRHSATGYIYTYPLMEPQPFAHRMQVEMISEIETNAPEFIVFARVDSSWLQSSKSDRSIFTWWDAYRTNYVIVGIADIIWPRVTKYAWGKSAARYGKLEGVGLEIYQRATPSPFTTNTPAMK